MPPRKAGLIIAALGAFAGCCLVFFHALPKTPQPGASSSTKTPAIKAENKNPPRPATLNAATTSASVIALQSSLPGYDTTATPDKIETSPALPPTGDYDLTLTAEQVDALVEAKYGELFQSLTLPLEAQARLRALLAERQQITIDAANSSIMTGLNPMRDLPTICQAIAQAQADVDATLRRELGELVFTACRNFDDTVRERNLVTDFSRLLAQTQNPLRPEQKEQVMQILKNFPGEAPAMDISSAIFGEPNTRARISEKAVAATATVLSPQQFESFRKLQQQWTTADAGHR